MYWGNKLEYFKALFLRQESEIMKKDIAQVSERKETKTKMSDSRYEA